MNNGTYITALPNKPHLNLNLITPQSTTQPNPSTSISNNFLNFLILEKTNFVDFSKAETYYEKLTQQSYYKYNQNKVLLMKRHEEYDNLLSTIASEVVNNYTMTSNLQQQISIKDQCDKYLITTLKSLIKQKEHNIECYNNSFKRLYKANYLLKKRIEQEQKYEDDNDEQYEKYQILKSNADLSRNHNEGDLKQLKAIIEVNRRKYKQREERKEKERIACEYSTSLIKKDIIHCEEVLTAMRLRNTDKLLEVNENKEINRKIKVNTIMMSKEFLKLKGRLLGILALVKVKEMPDCIMKLNVLRRSTETMQYQFNDLNSDISKSILTMNALGKKYEGLLLQIKETKLTAKYNKENKTEAIIARINELSNANKSKTNHIIKIDAFYKELIMFMVRYDCEILVALRLFPMNFFQESLLYDKYMDYFIIRKEGYTLNLERLNSDYKWHNEQEEYRFTLLLFKDFMKYVYIALSLALNVIIRKVNDGLKDKEEDNGTYSISFSTSNTPQGVILSKASYVIPFDSIEFFNGYTRFARKAMTHRLNPLKKGITNNSNEQIALQETTNRTASSIKTKVAGLLDNKDGHMPSISTTSEHLYISYLDHMTKSKCSSLEESQCFFQTYPRQGIALINKFSNDHVKNAQLNKSLVKFKEYITLFQSPIEIPKEITDTNADDSYEKALLNEQQSINQESNTNKTSHFCLLSNDKEKDMIYSRMIDLQRLDLNYFKNRDKNSVDPQKMKDLFLKYKQEQLKDKELEKMKATKEKEKTMKIILKMKESQASRTRQNYAMYPRLNSILGFGSSSIKDADLTMMTNGLGKNRTLSTMNMTIQTKDKSKDNNKISNKGKGKSIVNRNVLSDRGGYKHTIHTNLKKKRAVSMKCVI